VRATWAKRAASRSGWVANKRGGQMSELILPGVLFDYCELQADIEGISRSEYIRHLIRQDMLVKMPQFTVAHKGILK
jgi:hypothetical protein